MSGSNNFLFHLWTEFYKRNITITPKSFRLLYACSLKEIWGWKLFEVNQETKKFWQGIPLFIRMSFFEFL